MADYLFLFRGGNAAEARQSPKKWQSHMGKWMGALSEQGKFGGAHPLKPQGTTIKGASKIVTDGLFMEGKETVSGYLVCKGVNYEEAVEISRAAASWLLIMG